MTARPARSRPYAPDYCTAATLAYRLDMSEDTLNKLVRQGLLPPPIEITPGLRHWHWPDVAAFIAARNGVSVAFGSVRLVAHELSAPRWADD